MVLNKYSSYCTPNGTSLLLVIVVWVQVQTKVEEGGIVKIIMLGAVMKILHKLQYSSQQDQRVYMRP
jgi:hypothetical protein